MACRMGSASTDWAPGRSLRFRPPPEINPSRPITLVVPFPPGGSTSIVARIVADKMSAALGQPIVIDNRGGTGGTIATRQVARAAPDSYTILLAYYRHARDRPQPLCQCRL